MDKRIGVVGGGNMGGAIINSLDRKFKVFVCEKDGKKAEVLRRRLRIPVVDLARLAEQVDVVILAVKPQDSEEVLKELARSWTGRKLLISVAAGLTSGYLGKALGGKARVVRAMPNLPVIVRQGVTALCQGRHALLSDVRLAENIFSSLGRTVVVPENQMNAVTALSGSGPAYVFLFAECLLSAAKALGLNPEVRELLTQETLKGSLALWVQSGEDPAVLRQKVTSKGGTTQAALDVFFDHKVADIFSAALTAAHRRAGELAR